MTKTQRRELRRIYEDLKLSREMFDDGSLELSAYRERLKRYERDLHDLCEELPHEH